MLHISFSYVSHMRLLRIYIRTPSLVPIDRSPGGFWDLAKLLKLEFSILICGVFIFNFVFAASFSFARSSSSYTYTYHNYLHTHILTHIHTLTYTHTYLLTYLHLPPLLRDRIHALASFGVRLFYVAGVG